MEKTERKPPDQVTIFLWVLAGLALIVGIVLEVLGYDALVEALIIAFGIFLTNQSRYSTDRILDRLDRGTVKIIERLDRLIEKG